VGGSSGAWLAGWFVAGGAGGLGFAS